MFSFSTLPLLFSSALLAMMAGRAAACKCAYIPSVEDSFQEAVSVFLGTLVSCDSTVDPAFAIFSVDTMAKGSMDENSDQEKTVYTAHHSCGMMGWLKDESIGLQYLVYTFASYNDPEQEAARGCTRTTEFTEDDWDEYHDIFEVAWDYKFPECFIPTPLTGADCKDLIQKDRPDLHVEFIGPDSVVTMNMQTSRVPITVDAAVDQDGALDALVTHVPRVG
jgi:hypothetical protein